MPILNQPAGLLEALRGEMTPKFLATRNAKGIPNVVPLISLLPDEENQDILFFGNFLLRKSIQNLKEDPRVGILVVTPALHGWVLKGDFVEFQRTGRYVDRQMSGSLLRYNAYTGIRNAGVLSVRSVEGTFALGKLDVARDYALAKLASLLPKQPSGAEIPLPVRQEFARLSAVKVLAWIDKDGYPAISPTFSMQPAGTTRLVCRNGKQPTPSSGTLVATNILTLDAISYQAKGEWRTSGATGTIQVQEVYAGGPPYPGGRIV